MKKRMKRITALALALVLIASQLVLPVAADTVQNPDGSTTITSTTNNPDGSVTQTTTLQQPDGSFDELQVTTKVEQKPADAPQGQDPAVEGGKLEEDPSDAHHEDAPDAGDTPIEDPETTYQSEGYTETPGAVEGGLTPQTPSQETFTEPTDAQKEALTTTTTTDAPGDVLAGTTDAALHFDASSTASATASHTVEVSVAALDSFLATYGTGYTLTPKYDPNDATKILSYTATKTTPAAGNGTATPGQETMVGGVSVQDGSYVAPHNVQIDDLDTRIAAQEARNGAPETSTTTEGDVQTYVSKDDSTLIYTITTITTAPTQTLTGAVVDLPANQTKTPIGSPVTKISYLTAPAVPEKLEPQADGTTVKTTYTTVTQPDEFGVEQVVSIRTTVQVLDADQNVLSSQYDEAHATVETTQLYQVLDPQTQQLITVVGRTKTVEETIQKIESSWVNTWNTQRVDITTNQYTVEEHTLAAADGESAIANTDGKQVVVFEGYMSMICFDSTVDREDVPVLPNETAPGQVGKDLQFAGDHDPLKNNSLSGNWKNPTNIQLGLEGSGMQLLQLENGNDEHYVYSVEMFGNLNYGNGQGNKNQGTHILADGQQTPSTKYDVTEAVQKYQGALEVVAENGFWGTATNNNLDKIKEMLIANGVDPEVANALTPAGAVTASQATIWNITDNAGFGGLKAFGEIDTSIENLYQIQDPATLAYLNILMQKATATANQGGQTSTYNPNAETAKEAITADTVESMDLILHDKVTQGSSQTYTETATQKTTDQYNATMDLKLNITNSFLTDDLLAIVSDSNGNAIAKYRLSVTNKVGFGTQMADFFEGVDTTVVPDANGVYRLEGLVLPSGAVCSMEIKGNESLGHGIAIHNDGMPEKHTGNVQDMMALYTRGNRDVNLTFDFSFTPDDQTTGLIQSDLEFQRTGTITQTYNGTYTQKISTMEVKVEATGSQSSEVSSTVITSGDRSYVQEVTTVTKVGKGLQVIERTVPELTTLMLWDEDLQEAAEAFNPDVFIPDEEVPLAAAVKTGDTSQILAVISLISLSGAYLLSRRKVAI